MKALLFLVLTSYTVNISNSQRKIKDGQEVNSQKRYVAYFLKAEQSPQKYDAWICGGAIVSPSFIVTSAACVEDVQYMYAIAGYGLYVNAEAVDSDECAKAVKKKVILTCVPKLYNMSYDNIEKWSYIDIAAVKVESPYDFTQTDPIPECKNAHEKLTWAPHKININYEDKYQGPGTDAYVLGWGHKTHWRDVDDPKDYNQEILNYASTLIEKHEICKKYYQNLPELQDTIDKYMICTLYAGNIDENGELIDPMKPDKEGCFGEDNKAGKCKEKSLRDNTKSQGLKTLPPPAKPIPSIYNFDDISIDLRRATHNNTHITRRNGICQNDHGGPLVTWVGSHEVLIGVASVFRISNNSECVGPYLYTSTQCNGKFLDCVINEYDHVKNHENEPGDPRADNNKNSHHQKEKDFCDLDPAERGFEIVQRRISWKHHPDGPAKNELQEELFERPQIPLHDFNKRSKATKSSSTTSLSD